MDDNTLVNYFNPISKIKVIEVWSEAMSKKLDNLSFKSIILKREAKDSVFAKSVFPIIRNNEFATLIRTLKKLTRILSSGTRTLDSYREFNQAWDSFQNKNLQYPKTIRLIQKKLDQTIYKPLIKAIKKIESSDGEELSLIDQRLIELPEEIAQLSQLREIWLNGNQLEELPQWLTGLTKLEKIYLSGNRLYNFPSPADLY